MRSSPLGLDEILAARLGWDPCRRAWREPCRRAWLRTLPSCLVEPCCCAWLRSLPSGLDVLIASSESWPSSCKSWKMINSIGLVSHSLAVFLQAAVWGAKEFRMLACLLAAVTLAAVTLAWISSEADWVKYTCLNWRLCLCKARVQLEVIWHWILVCFQRCLSAAVEAAKANPKLPEYGKVMRINCVAWLPAQIHLL